MMSFIDEKLNVSDLPKVTHKSNGKIRILTQVWVILKHLIPKGVGSTPAAAAAPANLLEMQTLSLPES